MLKTLTINNFKAFANPITIDFSKVGDYSFNAEAIKDGIVKTSVIYGKNASGKTSLGLAIFDIVGTLTNNHIDTKRYYPYNNMLNNSSLVTFEYRFVFNDTPLTYSYSKQDLKTIVCEKLVIGNKTIIEYDKNKTDTSLLINMKGAEHINVELSNLNFSILRYIRANAILEDNKDNRIFKTFYNFVDKMLFFTPLDHVQFIGYTPIVNQDILSSIINNGHFDDLQYFFKSVGIEDVLDHQCINGQETLLIKYQDKYIDFNLVSSSGMKSLLLLYYFLEDISDSNKSPSLIFIDNFDAFYNYEVSIFIIEKLKKANCQVILTSHNTSIISNDILRPDCYYICSKDKITNLHHSTPKLIRFGNDLEKLYKGGAFIN